jgi:protein TonB
MKLSSFNEPPLTQSLRAPGIGIAVSVLLHALFWTLWSTERAQPQPPITPAQVIEVALVAAPPAAAPTPPQPEVKPPPPPPKPEKPPEKPAPKKPDKPKPKPVEKKRPRPEPVREEVQAPAPPVPPAVETAPAPVVAKPQAPAPQPFVAASYKDASLKNPPTRYPPVALERRWEGRVVLRVQVLPSGSAGEIRIESSSGHEILDNATVDQVKGWRFLPARRGDQAVASWVIVPIEYKLKH